MPTIRAEAARLADDAAREPSPTAPTWPRSSTPRATTETPGAGPGALLTPASPASSAWVSSAAPSPVDPATIAILAAGAWIDAGEPVVFLGDSGAGQ